MKGGGHKMAGGFSIDTSKIDNFKNFIFKKFDKISLELKKMKPLYLDSKIAPTAINIEFYEKVNILSPFGSGNPEPRFIIENLKTLNGKIVGNNHIKSVLIGSEGTSFKTIAFNASDTNLRLIFAKKNNHTFNIAGKLSLNEWRGKKKM